MTSMKASKVDALACTRSIHPKIVNKDGSIYGRVDAKRPADEVHGEDRDRFKRKRHSDTAKTSQAGSKRPEEEEGKVDWDRVVKNRHLPKQNRCCYRR